MYNDRRAGSGWIRPQDVRQVPAGSGLPYNADVWPGPTVIGMLIWVRVDGLLCRLR